MSVVVERHSAAHSGRKGSPSLKQGEPENLKDEIPLARSKKTYLVDSLDNAAFLISQGVDPIGTQRVPNGWTAWEFTWNDTLEALLEQLFKSKGEGGVVRRFCAARRRLLAENHRDR